MTERYSRGTLMNRVRYRKNVLLVLLPVVAAACASTNPEADRPIQLGMKAEEVRPLSGRPDYQRSRQGDEAWIWLRPVDSRTRLSCEILVLWFKDGVLIGETTHEVSSNADLEGCPHYGRTGAPRVDWGDMPIAPPDS